MYVHGIWLDLLSAIISFGVVYGPLSPNPLVLDLVFRLRPGFRFVRLSFWGGVWAKSHSPAIRHCLSLAVTEMRRRSHQSATNWFALALHNRLQFVPGGSCDPCVHVQFAISSVCSRDPGGTCDPGGTPLGTHEPTADKTPALAFAHRLWLSLTRHLRARLPRGRNPYYC